MTLLATEVGALPGTCDALISGGIVVVLGAGGGLAAGIVVRDGDVGLFRVPGEGCRVPVCSALSFRAYMVVVSVGWVVGTM